MLEAKTRNLKTATIHNAININTKPMDQTTGNNAENSEGCRNMQQNKIPKVRIK